MSVLLVSTVGLAIAACSSDAVPTAPQQLSPGYARARQIRHYRLKGIIKAGSITVIGRVSTSNASGSMAPFLPALSVSPSGAAGRALSLVPRGPAFDYAGTQFVTGNYSSDAWVSGTNFNFSTTTYSHSSNTDSSRIGSVVNRGRRTVSAVTGALIFDQTDSSISSPGASGASTTTGYPQIAISGGCSYTGAIASTHRINWWDYEPVTWYHTTPTAYAITGNSVNSAPYNASCAPDPGQQCIIADGCTLEDGGGGGPSGADAEVTSTVTFPDLSAPTGYHQVCIVTDWFQDGYGYLGTDIDECWYDPN